MSLDPRVQRMGEVLAGYSLAIKAGDWLVISSPIEGEPLAQATAEAATRAGANVSVLFLSEDLNEAILELAGDDQLAWVSPLSELSIEKSDAQLAIIAPRNTRTMSSADPTKLAKAGKTRERLSARFNERYVEGTLRWCVAAYPTPAAAQDAGMSLRAYEDFVYGAGLLAEPDPATAWRRLGERQDEIIAWLKDKKTIHVTGPGTDLRVEIGGRTWINDVGKENFPGGEIFTGPVEDSTEGVIEFSFPAFYNGREVPGVRLVFEHGVVTEASASGDQAFLEESLNMDPGARRLGEFAFGTNYGIQRFTKNTLFDEKIGGTLHLALGRSYPETGGTNESALHWDMVYNLRDGAEVRVDGELFSRNGEFCV